MKKRLHLFPLLLFLLLCSACASTEEAGTRLIFPTDSVVTASQTSLLLDRDEELGSEYIVTLSKDDKDLGGAKHVKLISGYTKTKQAIELAFGEELLTNPHDVFNVDIEGLHHTISSSEKILLNDGWTGYLYTGVFDESTPEVPGERVDYYDLLIGQEGSAECFYLTWTNMISKPVDEGENEYFHEGDAAYLSYDEMKAFASALRIEN